MYRASQGRGKGGSQWQRKRVVSRVAMIFAGERFVCEEEKVGREKEPLIDVRAVLVAG